MMPNVYGTDTRRASMRMCSFFLYCQVCTLVDATTKAYIIVNTLPRVWLQPETGILDSLQLFVQFLRGVSEQLEMRNLTHV